MGDLRLPRVLVLWAVLVLVLAAGLRLVFLDRIPGLNGDEAWYGIWSLDRLAGRDSRWVTPNGNAINAFLMLPTLALHAVFPPSIVLLRVPAELAGAAAVVATWALLRRPRGEAEALAAAILVATIPQCMGYARFGWDAAQIPLVSGIVAACVLRGNWIAAAAGVAIGFCVHPTLVLLAPLVALPFLAHRLADASLSRRRVIEVVGIVAGAFVVGGAVLAFLPVARSVLTHDLGSRLIHPSAWIATGLGLLRLLDGVTLYAYIVGAPSPSARAIHDLAFATAAVGLAGFGVHRLAVARRVADLSFLVGLLASAAALHAAAGSQALVPGWERYGFYLVAPTAIAGALLLGALVGPRRCLAASTGAGTLLLASFVLFYLIPLHGDGSAGHRAFTTGPEEPKVAAFRHILDASGEKAHVLAEDYWIATPLLYFSRPHPSISVVSLADLPDPLPPEMVESFREDMASGLWAVGFPGGPLERLVASAGLPGPCWIAPDAAGRPAILVWHEEAPRDPNVPAPFLQ